MHSPRRPTGRAVWAELPKGTQVDIVKLAPDGQEVARYPGVVIPSPDREWLAVEAIWTRDDLEIDGLRFVRGDRLIECFSAEHPFDAFAVIDPNGSLRGWYANVTWPAWIDLEDRPTVYWHDLYIDLIGLPSGDFTVRDEDELSGAAVAPELRAMIELARDELVRRFQNREMPFRIFWD